MNSTRLKNFIDLVRAQAACRHQWLLDRDAIRAEITAADLEELQRLDPLDRQAWATLLAHRLATQSSPFHTSPTRKPTP
jgi:hypothetical protein